MGLGIDSSSITYISPNQKPVSKDFRDRSLKLKETCKICEKQSSHTLISDKMNNQSLLASRPWVQANGILWESVTFEDLRGSLQISLITRSSYICFENSFSLKIFMKS